MADWMWFLTRASGIVAAALMAVAVFDGLVFSARIGRRARPAWWLDLHRGVGGYALIFTGIHLLTAYGADLGVGLADIVIPGHSDAWGTPFTYGVWAMYGLAVTVLTSWPRRRLRRPVWHMLHLLAIPALLLATLHGLRMGTDATTWWFQGIVVALCFAVSYPLGVRIVSMLVHPTPPTRTPEVPDVEQRTDELAAPGRR